MASLGIGNPDHGLGGFGPDPGVGQKLTGQHQDEGKPPQSSPLGNRDLFLFWPFVQASFPVKGEL